MPFSTDDHEPPNWITAKLANLVWRMTPDCREVTRLTSEGRDRPLPLGTRLRLGLHRCFCKWCARYAKQLDLLHEANLLFAEHVDQIGGPTLDRDAKSRMKHALQKRRTENRNSGRLDSARSRLTQHRNNPLVTAT